MPRNPRQPFGAELNRAQSPSRKARRSLLGDTSAMAMTEFALMLPVIMTLCLGGVELSALSMAYLRVNNIAIQAADNAARVRSSIDEADLNEIFTGAKLTGQKIDFAANGRIIVSSIEPVLDNGSPPNVTNQLLRWQRCAGANAANSTHGNQGDTQATGFGVPGKAKIAAAKNTAVILSEVVYNYQPLLTPGWFGPIVIRATQSITVRERSDQVIKNGSNLSPTQESLCTYHTA